MMHLKPNKNGVADISEFSGYISTKQNSQYYQRYKTRTCNFGTSGSFDGCIEVAEDWKSLRFIQLRLTLLQNFSKFKF